MTAEAQAESAARAGAAARRAATAAGRTRPRPRHRPQRAPDQLGGPTPCPEFDVDGLVRHLAGAADRAVVAARWRPGARPRRVRRHARGRRGRGAGPRRWRRSPAWADDATLDQVIELPWATLPARVLLAIYLSEVSTHTWDLAVATGQQPAFDDAAIEIALATMRMGLPAEGREQTPFGEVQPVADDAPAIDRLVAWTGRNPSWPPPPDRVPAHGRPRRRRDSQVCANCRARRSTRRRARRQRSAGTAGGRRPGWCRGGRR